MTKDRDGSMEVGTPSTSRGSTSAITWLHISDLHHGQAGQGGRWPLLADIALDDMAEMASVLGPPDLIIFTGDLSYSGKPEEFARVDKTLTLIRRKVGGDPIVVPVPGNHDLQRPSKSNASALAFKKYLSEPDLRKSVTLRSDKANLAYLRGLFQGYTVWWETSVLPDWKWRGLRMKPGLLPGDFQLSFERQGLRLGVVGVNSAFLQQAGGDYKGKLAVEPEQMGEEPAEFAREHHACLLLMHHPHDWLASKTHRRFLSDVYPSRHFIACLHGHMHENRGTLVSVYGQERRWIQASSLFGLERYGTDGEERVCGYGWGRLERVSDDKGRLTTWPRVARQTPGGDLEMQPELGAREHHTWSVDLREPETREPLMAPVTVADPARAWKSRALEAFGRELDQARELWSSGRFKDALRAGRELLERVEGSAEASDDADHQRVVARCQRFVAACLLCLQDRDRAREQAMVVDIGFLEPDGQIALANLLAQVGETEHAERAIEGLDSHDARVTRQLIAIERGQMPDDLLDDPRVVLPACAIWGREGQHDRVVERVLSILESTDERPLLLMQGLGALLSAMSWSVHDMPVGQSQAVEPARLRQAIALLQEHLDPMRPPERYRDLEPFWARLAFAFHNLSRDRVRWQKARALLEHDHDTALPAPDPGEGAKFDDHPWLPAFHDLKKSPLENLEDALGSLEPLVERFPGRMALEWLAAAWCLDAGRLDDSRAHAERAYAAFPGHGQATLLARVLYFSGGAHRERVWHELRDELEGSPDIVARRIRAQAASWTEPAQGPDAWQHVLEFDEADHLDQLELAVERYLQDDRVQAGRLAWQAYQAYQETGGARPWQAHDLVRCALLQLDMPDRAGLAQARELASVLWRRFQERDDRDAGEAYVRLWSRLGEHDSLPPLDVDRLAQAGILVGMAPEDLFAALHLADERRQMVEELYLQGAISLESLARVANMNEAELVERVARHGLALSTPLWLDAANTEVAGKEILMGVLELLLLDEFGVLPAFSEALGPDGRIVLFRDVYQRLHDQHAQLVLAERPEVLSRLRAARERISCDSEMGSVEKREADGQSQEQWAEQRQAVLVRTYVQGHGPGLDDVVAWLREHGHIGKSLARRFALVEEGKERPVVDMPERVALDASALRRIIDQDMLDIMLRALGGRVTVTPHALMKLDLDIDELQDATRARERSGRLRAWLQAPSQRERMRWIERPDVPLPEACTPEREDVRAWLAESASWRYALVREPGLWLLSADRSAADQAITPATTPLQVSLRWTPEGFPKLLRDMLATGERTISFSGILRTFAAGSRARECMDKALSLGFMDAYDARALVGLADEHGGLEGPRVESVLARIEERAHQSARHDRRQMAQRVALLYAQAIWAAFCESDTRHGSSLTRTLIERLEELARPGENDVWLVLFPYLCRASVAYPRTSVIRQPDDTVALSPEAPAAKMWHAISEWPGFDTHEHRITREVIAILLEQDVRPSSTSRWAWLFPLLMIANVVEDPGSPLTPGSISEAMAMVSANWPEEERPTHVLVVPDPGFPRTTEELLQRAARALAAPVDQIVDDGLRWYVAMDIGGTRTHLPLPPAALVLRADPETRRRLALRLLATNGSDDGRLHEPLMALAEDPDDAEARTRFAHLSASAPWRRFRAYPCGALLWDPMHLASHFPKSMEDLRTMLSEPDEALDGHDIRLDELLVTRVAQGSWRGRPDADVLLEQAVDIVGQAHVPLTWRSHAEMRGGEQERALARLARPHDQPAARVAADVLLCAASSGELGYERIATVVADVLEHVACEPPTTTLAAYEPALLRIAHRIVHRLTHRPEPMAAQLWMTWRLYQWMVRQFEGRTLESRAASMERLVSAEPDDRRRPGPDMLDPSRYGRSQLDIRLIAIMHALAQLSVHDLQAIVSDKLERVLVEVSQRTLTSTEIELQETMSPPVSFLGWGDVPGTVPGLAAYLLAALETDVDTDRPEDGENSST